MFNIQVHNFESVTFTFSEGGEGYVTITIFGKYNKVNLERQRACFEAHDGNDEIYLDWSHPDAILIGSEVEVGGITFSVAKTPKILESFLNCLEYWRLAAEAAQD